MEMPPVPSSMTGYIMAETMLSLRSLDDSRKFFQLAQDQVEHAPRLARPDHVHVEPREYPGVLPKGVRKGMAFPERLHEGLDDLLHLHLIRCLRKNGEAPVEGQPCRQKRGQLCRKKEELPSRGLDAYAAFESFLRYIEGDGDKAHVAELFDSNTIRLK